MCSGKDKWSTWLPIGALWRVKSGTHYICSVISLEPSASHYAYVHQNIGTCRYTNSQLYTFPLLNKLHFGTPKLYLSWGKFSVYPAYPFGYLISEVCLRHHRVFFYGEGGGCGVVLEGVIPLLISGSVYFLRFLQLSCYSPFPPFLSFLSFCVRRQRKAAPLLFPSATCLLRCFIISFKMTYTAPNTSPYPHKKRGSSQQCKCV